MVTCIVWRHGGDDGAPNGGNTRRTLTGYDESFCEKLNLIWYQNTQLPRLRLHVHSVTSQTVRKWNDGKDEAQELGQNVEEELQRSAVSEIPQKLLLSLLLFLREWRGWVRHWRRWRVQINKLEKKVNTLAQTASTGTRTSDGWCLCCFIQIIQPTERLKWMFF